MSYEDRVLVRLKRQYSKDEYVSVLLKKLSKSEVEKGMLKSEVDELIFRLKEGVGLVKIKDNTINQLKKSVNELKLRNDNLTQKCNTINGQLKYLINKK